MKYYTIVHWQEPFNDTPAVNGVYNEEQLDLLIEDLNSAAIERIKWLKKYDKINCAEIIFDKSGEKVFLKIRKGITNWEENYSVKQILLKEYDSEDFQRLRN